MFKEKDKKKIFILKEFSSNSNSQLTLDVSPVRQVFPASQKRQFPFRFKRTVISESNQSTALAHCVMGIVIIFLSSWNSTRKVLMQDFIKGNILVLICSARNSCFFNLNSSG